MKKTLLSTFFCCLTFFVLAQEATNPDLLKKQITAFKVEEAPDIDGDLSDEAWLKSESIASGFITLDPVFGNQATLPTEVKVLYDNTGIYVGAMMYDNQPDSIRHELVQRDGIGAADWFGVFIDPYKGGINGMEFIVTAAGVQFDALATPNGEDEGWDAVWVSAVRITDEGWVAEMKIPYSALRFPNKEKQQWHINFGRKIDRSQEKVFWSEINPAINGFLNQSGLMNGIEGIKSPVRLSATPFLAVYGIHSKEQNDAGSFDHHFGRSINGGMDIKYGINDAFTLDMTLIPDFGEARSDQEILNLGPFERRYDENRQFFTEGTDLFSKGNLFYSRRIGGSPLHQSAIYDDLKDGEEVISNPSQTSLFNATKLSGRTSKGLGVGWFNATAAREVATIKNAEGGTREFQTSPLTNYNVFVLDQNLKNNSSVSLINTTTMREGDDYDANVTGTVFDLRNKKMSYGIEGQGVVSQKYYMDSTALGHTFSLELKKISGNLNWGLSYSEESHTYDINDLGFLYNNNERSTNFWADYTIFNPKNDKFNRLNFGFHTSYDRLYQPNTFTEWGLNFWAWGQTRNFWNIQAWTYVEPVGGFDYFEPRVTGRYFQTPTYGSAGFNINSDRRKKIRLWINGRFGQFGDPGRYEWRLAIGPTFRMSNRFSFGFTTENAKAIRQIGFVNHLETGENGADPDVIFGRRDRTTIVNNLFTSYTFNNKMALTFQLYHYWSKGKYSDYYLLTEDGQLGETDYFDHHDFNFNAFNIDLQYRWRFAPGSDIFVVWKNAISNSNDEANLQYFENVNSLFSSNLNNQVSVKVIYYLDYLYFTKK